MFSGGYIFIEQFQNRKCTCASNRLIIYLVLLYRKIYYSNIYNRVKQCKVSCCLLYTTSILQNPYIIIYIIRFLYEIEFLDFARHPCAGAMPIFSLYFCTM